MTYIHFIRINILFLLIMTGIHVTSCSRHTTNQEIKPEYQVKKQIFKNKELLDLRNLIDSTDKNDFDDFKDYVQSVFHQIGSIIPGLSPQKNPLPDTIQKDVSLIHAIALRIKNTKNPQELETNVKAGFIAIISALRDINNTASVQLPDINRRLTKIEKMTQKISVKNYQKQIQVIFEEINTLMLDMLKAA